MRTESIKIAAFSAEIGVTRQAVYRKIKALNLSDHVVNGSLDEYGQEAIKKAFADGEQARNERKEKAENLKKQQAAELEALKAQIENTETAVLKTKLEAAEKALSEKNEIIKNKDQEISWLRDQVQENTETLRQNAGVILALQRQIMTITAQEAENGPTQDQPAGDQKQAADASENKPENASGASKDVPEEQKPAADPEKASDQAAQEPPKTFWQRLKWLFFGT